MKKKSFLKLSLTYYFVILSKLAKSLFSPTIRRLKRGRHVIMLSKDIESLQTGRILKMQRRRLRAIVLYRDGRTNSLKLWELQGVTAEQAHYMHMVIFHQRLLKELIPLPKETIVVKDFKDVLSKRNFLMPIFVLYRNPSDFPNDYVLRAFDLDKALPYVMVGKKSEIVKKLPSGHTYMERSDMDDDVIQGIFMY